MTQWLSLPVIWLIAVISVVSADTTHQDNYDYFEVDTSRSEIHWNCHHIGTVKISNGTLVFNDEELVHAEILADMNSIKNQDIESDLLQGTLENVLKSVEFFQTDNFPEAKFKLHSVNELENSKYEIIGDLIIFDFGVCTHFEANITYTPDSVYVKTNSIILDRTNWGIYYLSRRNLFPAEGEEGFVVPDTVKIDAYLQASRKKK